ncbi:AAA family ATPase [Roseibacillus persicicus]|uniref:AAA family ATPase n=1 Tax=Roseibacillus persicicus TaxID=454148 RepID=UPI00398B1225
MSNEELDSDQCSAIELLLNSTGRVVVLEGKAGTGKTTLLTAATQKIRKTGQEVFVFAPTSQASHGVLKGEGFENAETIQRFLVDERLQETTRHGVLWIDEAGLLSVPEMGKLFKIAEKQGARVILSGDRFQHHSVERGDGLRLVIESGLVEVGATRIIYRQRREEYRDAVAAISRGEVEEGFLRLDKLGAIREIPDLGQRLRTQAQEYVEAMKGEGSVLAVSPTHLEGKMMTMAIRALMKKEGRIAEEEIEVPVHRNRNLTAGQRALPHHLREGDIIRYFRHLPGVPAGSAVRIKEIVGEEVLVQELNGDSTRPLELGYSDRFQVYEERALKLSVGDKVRVNRNAKDLSGKRLFNGTVHELTKTTKEGQLILSDKFKVNPQEGFLDFGYVTTSHASQGRTAGKVLIGQSSLSTGSANLQQFYVSVSRARDEVAIFCDCKESLFEQICGEGKRELAIELKRQTKESQEEELEMVEMESEELAILGGATFGEGR